MSEAIKIKAYLTKYFISSLLGDPPKSMCSLAKEQRASSLVIRKSLLSAYYSKNLAISQEDGSYIPYRPHDLQASNDSPLFIHPESVLFHRGPKMICFHESTLENYIEFICSRRNNKALYAWSLCGRTRVASCGRSSPVY